MMYSSREDAGKGASIPIPIFSKGAETAIDFNGAVDFPAPVLSTIKTIDASVNFASPSGDRV